MLTYFIVNRVLVVDEVMAILTSTILTYWILTLDITMNYGVRNNNICISTPKII